MTIFEFYKSEFPELYETHFVNVDRISKSLYGQKKYTKWNHDKIMSSISEFTNKHGRLPRTKEFNKSNKLPYLDLFKNHIKIATNEFYMQHFPALYQQAFNNEKFKRSGWTYWNTDKIYSAISEFIGKHGRLPIEREFNISNGLPTSGTLKRHINLPLDEYFKSKFPNAKNYYRQKQRWSEQDIFNAAGISEFKGRY